MSKNSLFAFRLRRLLALAPSLFRRDALFRYAVIGGALALLALLSRPGDAPAPVPAPATARPPVAHSLSAPVPPPASLGADYGAAPKQGRPPEPISHDPPRIAPSHGLDELGAAQNPRPAPDRFGVIPRPSSEKN